MEADDRARISASAEAADALSRRATQLLGARARVRRGGEAAEREFRSRVRTLTVDGDQFAILPLVPKDRMLLGQLRAAATLPPGDPGLERFLAGLPPAVERNRADVRPLIGLRGRFLGDHAHVERARKAAAWLDTLNETVRDRQIDQQMDALRPQRPVELPLGSAADPSLGLATFMGLPVLRVAPASELRGIAQAEEIVTAALEHVDAARGRAQSAADRMRRDAANATMVDWPLDRLREATTGRLPLAAVRRQGWTTIGDLVSHERELPGCEGIGAVSASRLMDAAAALRRTALDQTPIRLDPDDRTPAATELLRSVRVFEAYKNASRVVISDGRLIDELGPLLSALRKGPSDVVIAASDVPAAARLLAQIRGLIARTSSVPRPKQPQGDPWDDFMKRPAEFYALLSELGVTTGNENKVHGDLPTEIVEAVRDLPLRGDLLQATLRGYQSFAARFALVQHKVVIGDEMGLGKTLEALAVAAHLRVEGKKHSLVICPAAVVTNWMREIAGKTDLIPYRVHGADREEASSAWIKEGGVAVTTYETLGWFTKHVNVIPDFVAVDEAHYIKNPQAKRSRRAAALIGMAPYAVLLTGTPLENKVGEFRQLVSYIRPDLTLDASDVAPMLFRRQVAPAYLRRNAEDVLRELPDRVETVDWLPLSDADSDRYREAVEDGNFMAMRQAAMLTGEDSVKLERLSEIVEEASENGRKTLVFSYFRKVLDACVEFLPGTVIGPLTGSVGAVDRQRMVDTFSNVDGPAVLVSQIMAGGVGLNIQAASVVVIVEPQLKPTTEDQAIARAHRMGQVRGVRVHRLLSEEGVDTRIAEILDRKRATFADFAATSATADASPEAFDVTDAELARQIVEDERIRLGIESDAEPVVDVTDLDEIAEIYGPDASGEAS